MKRTIAIVAIALLIGVAIGSVVTADRPNDITLESTESKDNISANITGVEVQSDEILVTIEGGSSRIAVQHPEYGPLNVEHMPDYRHAAYLPLNYSEVANKECGYNPNGTTIIELRGPAGDPTLLDQRSVNISSGVCR